MCLNCSLTLRLPPPPHRPVFMIPVPAKTVKNACVQPYPPMSTPVLLKGSCCQDGGTLHAVRSPDQIKPLLCLVSLHVCSNSMSPFFSFSKEKYANECPSNLVYSYQMTNCARTCQSLSQTDPTCAVAFTPVDGCGCAQGTYLSEKGECVPASECPCYTGEVVVLPKRFVQINGKTW